MVIKFTIIKIVKIMIVNADLPNQEKVSSVVADCSLNRSKGEKLHL